MAIGDVINVTLHGDREVKAALYRLGLRALPVGAQSLFDSAEVIMNVSKTQYVPVDTGTLQGSGYVKLPEIRRSTATVTLGYGGAAQGYALAVHENPRAGKTGGVSPGGKKYKRWSQVGEWKYLETPLKANVGNVVDKLKRDLAQELARL